MKLHYTPTKLPYYILSLFMVVTFASCGTMQTVTSNDDGIYADDEPQEQPKRRIVVANEKEYNEYQENYFTKEVERLGLINGTDIFTDIENYASEDVEFDTEEELDEDYSESNGNYNNNEPWGYNDDNSDVVININTSPRWGFYNDWNYGYGRSWWRSRNYRWGYDPYWHPYNYGHYYNNGFYVGIGGLYNPYYCPPYYRNNYYNPYRGYYNNRYYRNYRGSNPYRNYRTASTSRRDYT